MVHFNRVFVRMLSDCYIDMCHVLTVFTFTPAVR